MSRIKKHFNPATAVALIALVFAATGVSFAATGGGGGASNKNTHSLTASVAKSKSKTGPRGPKGATGAAGKNGVNGTNGAPGATGPAGSAGPAGPAGLTGKEGKEGRAGKNGEGEQGEAGPEGSPWTDGGTLPTQTKEGKPASETGAWKLELPPDTPENQNSFEEDHRWATFSFPIPLSAPLEEAHGRYITVKAQTETPRTGPAATECPGTAAAPSAAPGTFCVYEGAAREMLGEETTLPNAEHPQVPVFVNSSFHNLAGPIEEAQQDIGTAGTMGLFEYGGPVLVETYGTWAVTAP